MLISIGKFNFKKYFFLFVPLIKIIKESTNLYNAFYNVPNILIQYFFLCISKFANVIFWFILLKKIKFPKKESDKITKEIQNIGIISDSIIENKSIKSTNFFQKNSKGLSQKEINYNELEKEKRKKFYKEVFFLGISSLIDFIANFTYLISYATISNNNSNQNNINKNITNNNLVDLYNYEINETISNITDNITNNFQKETIVNLIPYRICLRIILIFIFSWFILNFERLHRHQFVSILIIVIISALTGIIEFSFNIINRDDYYYLNNLIIILFQEFFFSLDNVIGAKYLSISKGNVYKLLFFNGSFGIIMIIILSFLTSKMNCSRFNINEKFCENDELRLLFNLKQDIGKILKVFICFILTIIEMACTWLLIFYQTINHLSVACAIHLTFRFLIGRINYNISHIIIGIVALILIVLISLIFNEIIILRFWTLEKNTTEEIELRAIEDKTLVERPSNISNLDGTTFEV